ncbi:MAG: hypothetical protein PHS60_16700, partial [Zavarzinia sp.]|nr:hypothetical protein [Zavarzinia sp.]
TFATDLDDQGEVVAADMAAFEWALGLAFDAAAGGTVPVERLATLAPEAWDGLRPRFQPGFGLVTVRHDVHEAWARFQAGEITQPAPLPTPVGLLTWRAGLDVRYRVAVDDEVRLITALRIGQGFGAAVGDSAVEPARAVELLAGWCLSAIVSSLDGGDEK